jgi:molybdate transport system permease protein
MTDSLFTTASALLTTPNSPLWLSLKVAACATGLSLLVGLLCAYSLLRFARQGGWQHKLSQIFDAGLMLPLVLPPTVIGYYLLVFLGRNGPLGAWLEAAWGIRLIFTWQGAALAAAVIALPLIYKAARAALESVEPTLLQAGRVLGLSETAIFLRISLPLAWRGIAAGALLAFARSMGEFGATLMVAGSLPGKTQTLSLAVYEAVQAGQTAEASALVWVTLMSATALLLLAAYLLNPRDTRGLGGRQ